MATITKTFTENRYSNFKSTWSLTMTRNDFSVSGSTFVLPAPTLSAYYTTSANKHNAYARVTGDEQISIPSSFYWSLNTDPGGSSVPEWEPNTIKYLSVDEPSQIVRNTSDWFNSSNPTEGSIPISIDSSVSLRSQYDENGTVINSYDGSTTWNNIYNVVLNAPPTFDVSSLNKDTDGYYINHTVVSVTVSNVDIKYGGNLSSVVFNIGDQSTGAPSATTFYIRLNKLGTFTPTVTVKDSRGQTNTVSFPSITVVRKPPTCTATVTSSAPYIKNYSSYAVNITNATATDATVSSIKLTVGNQTASRSGNGTLSITPNTNGTFTPTVVIKDSNSTSKTYTLSSITVQDPTQPTFNVSATTSSPYVRTKNSYAVSITNATASYGGSISSAKLIVGDQSVTGTVSSGSGSLTINPLNSAGTFTPSVTLTDNRGLSTTKTLSNITVLDYNTPSIAASVIRCDSSGIAADEGTYALVTAQITYSKARCNLNKPTMSVTNQSGSSVSTSQTWYTDRALSSAVNWTNYNPNSPVTLYCLVSGNFTEQAYNISCYVTDSLNGQSSTISQVLSASFYTIDIQAGGKEIAFGKPANDNVSGYSNGLFYCAMEIQTDGNINIASGKKYKINGSNLSASDVGAVPTSRKVNNKALSSDISLTASDVGALSSSTTYVSGVKGNSESSYRTGNVNLTPANVGAVNLSDKYTRSSTGDLAWTGQTDGDAKVIAKSALAFWNGAYSGSGSNLSKCSTGNIIGSNGGTMTGELLTSFSDMSNSSSPHPCVAIGSYGAVSTTIPNLIDEVRLSSGLCGSVSISTAYTLNSVTVPTGWYNFMWIPHRTGGKNRATQGDNCNYGNLILFGMNNTNGRYIVRFSSSIKEVAKIPVVGGWTSAGTATGTATVTIPEDGATEVYVVVKPYSTTNYSGQALISTLTDVWVIGGYYISTSDYGLCNLNVTNSGKTFQIRNCRYGGIDRKSSSTLTVYYR